MIEPTPKQLRRLPNRVWATALSLFYRDHHTKILEIQWDLILSGRFAGDRVCQRCYDLAIKVYRKRRPVIQRYRPRLNK